MAGKVHAQPDLFDVGERIQEAALARHKVTCTPSEPGSGPEGKRCGDCRFATLTRSPGGKRCYKCGRMREAWTHGSGSDVRLKWPACSEWKDKP